MFKLKMNKQELIIISDGTFYNEPDNFFEAGPCETDKQFMVYIPDESKKIPIKDALTLMTDEWIERGNESPQTIIDLCNILRCVLNMNNVKR